MWYIVYFYNGRAYGSCSFKHHHEALIEYTNLVNVAHPSESYVVCDASMYDIIRGIE